MKILFVYLSLMLMACAPIQDSPFSDKLLNKNLKLNVRALEKLKNVESDGIIRIAVLADPHQNYAALDDVVNDINNTRNIDFIVNVGDIGNSGYNFEYDQYIDSYVNLRQPAFTVIGNHDALGAGVALYRKAFSEPNFWFETDTKRYIFFNTANLEKPEFFDPQWLKDAVNSTTKAVIIFTHCSLLDPERFASGTTAQIFSDVINASNVDLVVNGHLHAYGLNTVNNTILLQSDRVQGLNWLLLEIQGTQLSIENMTDKSKAVVTLKM